METKYKGFEELLDVDEDDPDIVVPKDLQGSVRALNYALAHPLIFSEPHGTYKERRVKKSKVTFPFFSLFQRQPPRAPRETYMDSLSNPYKFINRRLHELLLKIKVTD